MKTRDIFITGIILLIGIQSCTKDYLTIEGEGEQVTKTLNLSDFSKLKIQGVDNVYIQYGEIQSVKVVGQANIIERIKRDVRNNTWYVQLQNGSYGHYDLSYYITLPKIDRIENIGTGDVIIENEMVQNSINVLLNGSGSFYGFSMNVEDCKIKIIGSGNAEISVNSYLDVYIEGSGNVYYKGYPDINNSISGSGKLISEN